MKTPLFERHAAAKARMAPFAGWEMPIQYEGILKEHRYTRNSVSVFDTCHMGEFYVSGSGAAAFLDRLLTQRIGTLQVGQARYGYLLNENGGVLDDAICFRLAEDRFGVVVNAGTRQKDADWMTGHLRSGVVFEDRSDETGKLDVQGPQTRAAVESAFRVKLPDLKFFSFVETRFDDISVMVSRTGYTGEFGYEIFFPACQAVMFWDRLLESALVRPAGLGARDTLRLEMGYPLYGHELSESRTPAGIARKSFVDVEKEFIGREAVLRDAAAGPDRLVGLLLEGRRAAREGTSVYQGDRLVGKVTSGSFSPSLETAVAMAYVKPDAGQPDRSLFVDLSGTRTAARVVSLPFYNRGTARIP